jgi:hypothetical protein
VKRDVTKELLQSPNAVEVSLKASVGASKPTYTVSATEGKSLAQFHEGSRHGEGSLLVKAFEIRFEAPNGESITSRVEVGDHR